MLWGGPWPGLFRRTGNGQAAQVWPRRASITVAKAMGPRRVADKWRVAEPHKGLASSTCCRWLSLEAVTTGGQALRDALR